ncbi:MAG: hypothetical protein V4606_03620 [Patescibacteria group bacterium]
MFSDSRLQSLQSELESLHRAQTDARKEVERLQKARDAKLEQIKREYDSDIAGYERKYGTANSRIPDVTRQIENRQRELQRELERSAANTNSAPKKSGWL